MLLLLTPAAMALAQPVSVLWLHSGVQEAKLLPEHRQAIVAHLNGLDGGARFDAKYVRQSGGQAARELAAGQYDIVVVDGGHPRTRFNTGDLEAIKRFYAGGRRVVMLDGTLLIRSTRYSSESRFPGVNASSAALTENQLLAIHAAGGGILIGADHRGFQVDANQVARALIPGAGFSGTTNPSTNGEFIGTDLLSKSAQIVPMDLFRHWASIPSQGEVSVGSYADFEGRPLELYALVEAADKGGSRRRPYISVTFNPGDKRFDINSEEAIAEPLPLRVGPSRAENQGRAMAN